jgi:hypothetical protein
VKPINRVKFLENNQGRKILMDECTYRLSLFELISRPAVELRLVGSDGDDDNDGNPGDQDDGDNDGDDQDGDDSDKENKANKGNALKKTYSGDWARAQRKIDALDEEKLKHYDLRKEAEAKLATAEARIAELEKNGTTDEGTRTKLVDNEREIANLKVLNTDLALENQFLQSNKYKWKKASAALKLADLSKVEIDPKTGSVMGLDDALDALATENSWLLEADENDGDDDDKTPKPRRTGDSPADKVKKGDKSAAANKQRLQSKYAGLRR